MCCGPDNKETRVKAQFGPTESGCAERTESVTLKGPWGLTPPGAGEQRAAQSEQIESESPARVTDLGLDDQELNV